MKKNHKLLLGAVAVAVIGYLLYKKNKDKKAMTTTTPIVGGAAPATTVAAPVAGATAGMPPVMSNAQSAGFGTTSGMWVVGGYDPLTNTTYIFPDGNLGGGTRVTGRMNLPQGSLFHYVGGV